MNFDIAGPFSLQLTPGGLVAASAPARKAFWKMADSEYVDISTARGCYIFALRSPNGTMPWYVGKAASNSFAGECLQPHKIVHYNNSFQGRRYSPQLFFIPKYTAGGKYAAQSKNAQHDIDFLETYLIGLALKRNSELQNIAKTAFLKNMHVPGIINPVAGKPSTATIAIRSTLGL